MNNNSNITSRRHYLYLQPNIGYIRRLSHLLALVYKTRSKTHSSFSQWQAMLGDYDISKQLCSLFSIQRMVKTSIHLQSRKVMLSDCWLRRNVSIQSTIYIRRMSHLLALVNKTRSKTHSSFSQWQAMIGDYDISKQLCYLFSIQQMVKTSIHLQSRKVMLSDCWLRRNVTIQSTILHWKRNK